MAKEIPEKYYGKAMEELDSYPKANLLAKCIAKEGSVDAGRAKYISKRAKKLFAKHLEKKEMKREEQREEQRQIDEERQLEEFFGQTAEDIALQQQAEEDEEHRRIWSDSPYGIP
jgi:hypothetical protein